MFSRVKGFFFKFLSSALFFILVACATSMESIKSIDNRQLELFKSGNIELKESIATAFKSEWAVKDLLTYYSEKQWENLAKLQIAIGWPDDLGYFFLGRAAEEMGYLDSARIYYKRSLAISQTSMNCAGLINNCRGFIFPRDSQSRLAVVDRKISTQYQVAVVPSAPEEEIKQINDTEERKPIMKEEIKTANYEVAQIIKFDECIASGYTDVSMAMHARVDTEKKIVKFWASTTRNAKLSGDLKIKNISNNGLITTKEVPAVEIFKSSSFGFSPEEDQLVGSNMFFKLVLDPTSEILTLKAHIPYNQSKKIRKLMKKATGAESGQLNDDVGTCRSVVTKRKDDLYIKDPTETAGIRGKDREIKPLGPIDLEEDPPVIKLASNSFKTEKPTIVIKGNVSDQSKIIELRLQDQRVPIDNRGNFNLKKAFPIGENSFTLTAIDEWGNRGEQNFTVSRTLQKAKLTQFSKLDPFKIEGKKKSNALIVIIGLNKYKNLPPAQFADSDAIFFYDFATKGIGIEETQDNAILLLNEKATRLQIQRLVKQHIPAAIKAGKTDIYFFFAGHGLASADGNELYLMVHESETGLLEDSAINLNQIVATIKSYNPKSITVFLDTCYAGASRDGESLVAGLRPAQFVVKGMKAPLGVTVLSASANNQISHSLKEAEHGLFSYYLMKGMMGEADLNKDKKISLGEIHEFTLANVPSQALRLGREQTPQLQGDSSKIIIEW